MKSTVLFVLIFVIGALGGFAAAELRPILFDDIVPDSDNNGSTQLASLVHDLQEKHSKEIKSIKQKFDEEYETRMNDMEEKLQKENEKNTVKTEEVISDDENINSLQRQVNELRGEIIGIKQNIDSKVTEEIEKNEVEKQKQEEEAEKQRQEERTKRMNDMRTQMVSSHADRMKNELGLTDSQALSVKEALSQYGEKMQELFSNRENWGNRDEMRQKMEGIQNEWEETAKSVLTTEQYDQFLEKNLNRMNPMGGRFNRGGGNRGSSGR